jgi:hypothetical protein
MEARCLEDGGQHELPVVLQPAQHGLRCSRAVVTSGEDGGQLAEKLRQIVSDDTLRCTERPYWLGSRG